MGSIDSFFVQNYNSINLENIPGQYVKEDGMDIKKSITELVGNERILAVNLTGPMYAMRKAVKVM